MLGFRAGRNWKSLDTSCTGIDFFDHENKEVVDLYEMILREAAAVKKEHQVLSRNNVLYVDLRSGGGFVAHFTR